MASGLYAQRAAQLLPLPAGGEVFPIPGTDAFQFRLGGYDVSRLSHCVPLRRHAVVSKLKRPVFVASEVSG